jgi:two-component system, NtrC family, sensor kinase
MAKPRRARGQSKPKTKAELERALKHEHAARKRAVAAATTAEAKATQAQTERDALRARLDESVDQQTATSEILGVIASSPRDLQPIFDTIADRAMRLCNGDLGFVYLLDGALIHVGGLANLSEEGADIVRRVFPLSLSRGTFAGRAILTGDVIHIADALEDPEYTLAVVAQTARFRSCLVVPMLRDGRAIGAIATTRGQPGFFTEHQIALLKTFADQAIIAIESACSPNSRRRTAR